MREELSQFKHRTLVSWSAVTVEILASALLYATMRTLGTSEHLSTLVSGTFAVLCVVLGLIFVHKIYPKATEKSVKVSLFEDYLTTLEDVDEAANRNTINAALLDALESTLPLYSRKTAMSTWLLSDADVSILEKSTKGSSKIVMSVTYVDLKGRHISLIMDNPGKVKAFDIISVLTKEVKESLVVPSEQKKEQIEVIDRITKEAFKSKPNKTLLKALSEGLADVFKASPGMDKAASDANSLTSLLNNLA